MPLYKKLTHKHPRTATETAARINADYPGAAIVKDDCCFITQSYYRYCRAYVLEHCSLKNYSYRGLQVKRRQGVI